ncbi:unnamed protein product [Phytophthora lilii]|uniref:Unnamed protein product n=1 Tax=Phytophthora lilii TaxID=2077276 RepID=A0A9W6U9V7_9STRA|nr:unnamed protein product [Phytophthora lilii]
MRFSHILLLTVLSFFTSNVAFGAIAIARVASTTAGLSDRRVLRAGIVANADSIDTEERGALKLEKLYGSELKMRPKYKYYEKFLDQTIGPKLDDWIQAGKSEDYVLKTLNLEKLAGNELKMSPKYKYYDMFLDATVGSKVDDWLQAGKSIKYVKKELGLRGLTESALLASPKYKFYEKYVSRQLDEWLKEGRSGLPTHVVWSDLGLSRVVTADAYNVYVRYANMYDDQLYQLVRSGSEPLIVVGGFSEIEMIAKVRLWAEAKRPKWYVKKLLGIENKSEAKVATNEYYQLYLKLTQQTEL